MTELTAPMTSFPTGGNSYTSARTTAPPANSSIASKCAQAAFNCFLRYRVSLPRLVGFDYFRLRLGCGKPFLYRLALHYSRRVTRRRLRQIYAIGPEA